METCVVELVLSPCCVAFDVGCDFEEILFFRENSTILLEVRPDAIDCTNNQQLNRGYRLQYLKNTISFKKHQMSETKSAAKASRAYAAISSKLTQWEDYGLDDDDGISGYVVSKRKSGQFSPPAQSSTRSSRPAASTTKSPMMFMGTNTSIGVESASKWKPMDTPAKEVVRHDDDDANMKGNTRKNTMLAAQNISVTQPKFVARPSLNSDYRPYHDALLAMLHSSQEQNNIRGSNNDKYMQYIHSIMRSTYAQATSLRQQANDSPNRKTMERLEYEGHFWSLLGKLLQESPKAQEDFLLYFPITTVGEIQQSIAQFVKEIVDKNASLEPAVLASLVQDSLRNLVGGEGNVPSPPDISKRRQCILEWVQSCHGRAIDFDISHCESKVMWKDTIKSLKLNRLDGENKKKVDSIHPDAPFFVNDVAPLYGNDNQNEVQLLTKCIKLMKAGRFAQALELCADSGQSWRVAAWDGNAPHGHVSMEQPNDSEMKDDNEIYALVGNPQRALWKRTVWRASEAMNSKVRSSGYGLTQVASGALVLEAAIMAILADDIKTASNNPMLSRSWLDRIWLYYHGVQAYLMELVFHSLNNKRRSIIDGEKFPLIGTEFLKEEEEQLTCTADMSRLGEGSFLHSLQSSFNENSFWIKGISAFLAGVQDVKSFIYGMTSELIRSNETQTDEYEANLRFMVHLVLFLESFCQVDIEEYTKFYKDAIEPQRDQLIIAYLLRLMSEKPLWEFFNLYASMLPTDLTLDVCTKFWYSQILDEKDRKMVLNQARKYFEEGLDLEILRRVVRAILSTTEKDEEIVNDLVPSWLALLPLGNDGLNDDTLVKQISSIDIYKIHGLYWLTFFEEHYADSLICGNILLRELILSIPTELSSKLNEHDTDSIMDWSSSSKLYAAKLLQSRVISFSIARKAESRNMEIENMNISSSISEYHALADFLRAHSAYESWKNYISNTESIVAVKFDDRFTATSVESEVAMNVEIMRYVKKKREQAIGLFKVAESARSALMSVLEFQDVGWLKLVTNDDSEEEMKRRFEVERLRTICLPMALSLVYRVLNDTAIWMTDFKNEVFDIFGERKGLEVYGRIEFDGGVPFIETPFQPSTWYRHVLLLANTVAASEYDISSCLDTKQLNEFMQCMADTSINLLMLQENQ